jgi:protocatechuate 3,4-dioxygenase beta subunit
MAAACFSVCLLVQDGLSGRVCSESVELVRTVEGIVTDEQGRPLEGAEVALFESESTRPGQRKRSVRTGADGKFRFPVTGRGMVRIDCVGLEGWRTRVARRHVSPDSEPLRYVLRRETGNEADFAAEESEVVIRGRVVDLAGHGIADANILGLGELEGAHCMSLEEGRFELRWRVAAGWGNSRLRMMLYVNKPEERLAVVRRVTFNERWEYDVTIEVPPYRRICEARVVNNKGQGMGGVDVLRKNHMSGLGLKWVPVAKTGENGKYEVSDLIVGMTYSFCGLSEEYGTADSGCVWWNERTYSLKPIVVVARDKVLEGVAVDEKGKAVGGAKISLGSCPGVRSEVLTDEKGRFRFAGLVPGEVRLQGHKRDRQVHGGWLFGSQRCSAGEKQVKLVLRPEHDAW